MSAIVSIVRRELSAYFVSPIAYTVIVIFLLIGAFGFVQALAFYAKAPAFLIEQLSLNLRNTVVARTVLWLNVGMVLSLPALSMRLFSEERKGGTAELLLTSPITTTQLVLGKYLGSLGVLLVMLALTLPFAGVLQWLASPEWPALAAAYLGLFLYGAVILGVGVFASSLTENQIVALLLTYALFLPFWLVELLVGFMGGRLDDVLAGLSVGYGLRLMGLGLVDTHYVVLDVALAFTFLFLCVQVLDSNRWR